MVFELSVALFGSSISASRSSEAVPLRFFHRGRVRDGSPEEEEEDEGLSQIRPRCVRSRVSRLRQDGAPTRGGPRAAFRAK
eukprot:4257569-Pyramimonas_sp.AAC.1